MFKYRSMAIVLALAAGATLSVGQAATNPLQKCGPLNGKAFASLIDALGKEGARICAKGAPNAALDAKPTAAAKATSAFDNKNAQGLEKYGAANCVFGLAETDSATVLSSTQGLGDLACSESP